MDVQTETTDVSLDTQPQADSSVQNDSVQTGDQGSAQEVPAYTPNYKFRYTAKMGEKVNSEGEFDEWLRPAIKSKEHEEKLRDIYQKAMGIDFIKEARDAAKNEYKTYREQVGPIIDLAKKASEAFQRGDLDMFFEHLGVPYQKIQQHVYSKLQRADLPPEQRQIIEQNEMLKRQQWDKDQELLNYQQQNQKIQQEMLYNQLQNELSRPEISSIQQSYDASNGAGKFEELVKQHGHFIYVTQNGRVASPGEVVQSIIKNYGLKATPAPAPTTTVVPPTEKPVIPVVQGGASSPVAKKVRSIADVEALYKEKYGS